MDRQLRRMWRGRTPNPFAAKAAIFLAAVLCAANAYAAEDRVRFAVVSDSQGMYDFERISEDTFSQIVANVMAVEPAVDFVVVCGDLVFNSDDSAEWIGKHERWREIAQPWYESTMSGAKVYVLPGNHDASEDNWQDLWKDVFADLPRNGPGDQQGITYSFDAGPGHFVCVNTESPGGRHRVAARDWVAADLAGTDRRVKFVFGHEPAYPAMLHIGSSLDVYPEERDAFWAMLAENEVTAYFCGHEHMFDRWVKDGVQQIVVAGAGNFTLFHHFVVVDVTADAGTLTVYRLDGSVDHAESLFDVSCVNDVDRPADQTIVEGTIGSCAGVFAAIVAMMIVAGMMVGGEVVEK